MVSDKPLAVELFAGLHGWGEGFVAEGFRCIGFDIVDMCANLGVQRPIGCELVIQDVLTLHGSQLKDAAVIVASPPCQRYSYMAMPWNRAKREIRWQEWQRTSPFSPGFDLNDLFDACFRIQREASEAAGRHIPMVVENVKGAQPWVGSARWHFGSYYLWGDVPALMPTSTHRKLPPEVSASIRNGKSPMRWTNAAEHYYEHQDAAKVPGINWSGYGKPGHKSQGFNVTAAQRFREEQGVKQNGSGPEWFDNGIAKHSSRSDSRKAASAQIAKIPFALASHIARVYRVYKPHSDTSIRNANAIGSLPDFA